MTFQKRGPLTDSYFIHTYYSGFRPGSNRHNFNYGLNTLPIDATEPRKYTRWELNPLKLAYQASANTTFATGVFLMKKAADGS